MKNEDMPWSSDPKDGIISIPDELDSLFNKIGMQLRFHTISGKNETQTVADILWNADKFYREKYEGK